MKRDKQGELIFGGRLHNGQETVIEREEEGRPPILLHGGYTNASKNRESLQVIETWRARQDLNL